MIVRGPSRESRRLLITLITVVVTGVLGYVVAVLTHGAVPPTVAAVVGVVVAVLLGTPTSRQ